MNQRADSWKKNLAPIVAKLSNSRRGGIFESYPRPLDRLDPMSSMTGRRSAENLLRIPPTPTSFRSTIRPNRRACGTAAIFCHARLSSREALRVRGRAQPWN